MRLYVSGVSLPKLDSLKDRVLREFINKEAEKEIKKTQLLALLVSNTLPSEDDRAQKIWSSYLGLMYGVEIPEHDDATVKMMEYYSKYVKNLKPKLVKVDGKLVVTGLEDLSTQNPK